MSARCFRIPDMLLRRDDTYLQLAFKGNRRAIRTSSRLAKSKITYGSTTKPPLPTEMDCAVQACSTISMPLAFGMNNKAIAATMAAACDILPIDL